MALNTLCDELLLLIISFVPPLDVEAFTATCRRVQSVGAARLVAHRALKARYGSVLVKEYTEYLQTGLTKINHPIQLFNDILNNPWIADYVNYICFECNHHSLDHLTGDTGLHASCTAIVRTLERRGNILAAPAFKFLTGTKRQVWQDGILKANTFSCFVALLPLLSNLKRLRLTGYRYDPGPLADLYEYAQSTPGLILPKLSTVEAYNHDTEGSFHGDDLTVFSQFPSVKKLIGHWVNIKDQQLREKAYPGESAVEVLALTDSGIQSKEALARVLQPMKALREFRFSLGPNMGPFSELDCRHIAALLLEHVAETLEVLSLTVGQEINAWRIGSLQGLKKLRELEIDFEMLIGEFDPEGSEIEDTALESGFHEESSEDEDETTPRAVDILPTSIERIVLNLQGHEDDVEAFLEALTTDEGLALSNLKKFVYHGRTLDEDVRAILKDAGVSIGRRQGWPFKAHHDRFWDEDPGLTNN